MRRALALLASSILGLAAAAGQALPFQGTLTIGVGEGLAIAGSGEGVSTPSSASISSGGFLTTRVEALANQFFPLTSIEIGSPAGLAAGSWGSGLGPGGGFGGDAPLQGTLRAGFLGPPRLATLTFPLGVIGVEGATASASTAGLGVRVRGGGWTTGRVSFTEGISPPSSATGGDFRTPGGAGNLVLISATAVRLSIDSFDLPLFTTLDLTFEPEPSPGVPEPGGLLLFGLGSLLIGRALRRGPA